jgi:hypothetical protein
VTIAADRVTRVAADLYEAATDEGARQSRSAKQQLDHWAQVGHAEAVARTDTARVWDNSSRDGPTELSLFAKGMPIGPCRWPRGHQTSSLPAGRPDLALPNGQAVGRRRPDALMPR